MLLAIYQLPGTVYYDLDNRTNIKGPEKGETFQMHYVTMWAD